MNQSSKKIFETASLLSSPEEAIEYLKYKTAPVRGMPTSIFRSRNIVMFHMGRCGSSVLGDILYQNSQIQWSGEIYFPYIREWRKQKAQYSDKRVALKPDPLRILRQKMFTAGSKNFGCEIKFHHITEGRFDIQNFINILDRKGFTYIVLKRDNFLRSIISHTVMYNLSEKKTHNKSSENATLKQVYIDIENTGYNGYKKPLIEHLNIHKENYAYLENLLSDHKYLSLNFEKDISADPNNAYSKVCHFLNIEPEEISVRLSKTNPFSLSDIIVNYDEVKSYLKDTEYAWMCG